MAEETFTDGSGPMLAVSAATILGNLAVGKAKDFINSYDSSSSFLPQFSREDRLQEMLGSATRVPMHVRASLRRIMDRDESDTKKGRDIVAYLNSLDTTQGVTTQLTNATRQIRSALMRSETMSENLFGLEKLVVAACLNGATTWDDVPARIGLAANINAGTSFIGGAGVSYGAVVGAAKVFGIVVNPVATIFIGASFGLVMSGLSYIRSENSFQDLQANARIGSNSAVAAWISEQTAKNAVAMANAYVKENPEADVETIEEALVDGQEAATVIVQTITGLLHSRLMWADKRALGREVSTWQDDEPLYVSTFMDKPDNRTRLTQSRGRMGVSTWADEPVFDFATWSRMNEPEWVKEMNARNASRVSNPYILNPGAPGDAERIAKLSLADAKKRAENEAKYYAMERAQWGGLNGLAKDAYQEFAPTADAAFAVMWQVLGKWSDRVDGSGFKEASVFAAKLYDVVATPEWEDKLQSAKAALEIATMAIEGTKVNPILLSMAIFTVVNVWHFCRRTRGAPDDSSPEALTETIRAMKPGQARIVLRKFLVRMLQESPSCPEAIRGKFGRVKDVLENALLTVPERKQSISLWRLPNYAMEEDDGRGELGRVIEEEFERIQASVGKHKLPEVDAEQTWILTKNEGPSEWVTSGPLSEALSYILPGKKRKTISKKSKAETKKPGIMKRMSRAILDSVWPGYDFEDDDEEDANNNIALLQLYAAAF